MARGLGSDLEIITSLYLLLDTFLKKIVLLFHHTFIYHREVLFYPRVEKVKKEINQ